MTTRRPSPFGLQLRALRRERGWTQEQLADVAGVSLSVIKFVETGRTWAPEPQSIEAFARAFELAGKRRSEFVSSAEPASYDDRLAAIERRQDQQEALLREILDRLPDRRGG